MSLSLLIPYRRGDERERPRADEGVNRSVIMDFLLKRWAAILPEAEVIVSGPHGEVMNRSEARNRAFARSSGDILVVADADIIAHRTQIDLALRKIAQGASWVIGFRRYIQLTGGDTRRIVAADPAVDIRPPRRVRWSTDQGNAGLMIMRREAWEAVRGYDERFVAWGWEDWAFANALETLVHPQERVRGYVLHLCHPRPRDRSKRQGKALFDRYHAAHGDPRAMRSILEEPGRCG